MNKLKSFLVHLFRDRGLIYIKIQILRKYSIRFEVYAGADNAQRKLSISLLEIDKDISWIGLFELNLWVLSVSLSIVNIVN